jgi:hypothetical protein
MLRERERANRIFLRHCLRWIGVKEEGAGPELRSPERFLSRVLVKT